MVGSAAMMAATTEGEGESSEDEDMKDAIQGPEPGYSNLSTAVLSGGVGGARFARGLAAVDPGPALTVVGNVGDDDVMYGLHVSPDLDTITYTLAGIQGEHGWGIEDDTFTVIDNLAQLGTETAFRLGDRDMATCLNRTIDLGAGVPLSVVTDHIRSSLGVTTRILPATDDPLRTHVVIESGTVLSFQDYFVVRGHADEVSELRYTGAERSSPAPGVIASIRDAAFVVIAPSNPPLSIWPILAVPGVREAVREHPSVAAISPLFRGRALKGPADRVMASLGLPPGNAGVLAAYDGLISDLVIDVGDAGEATELADGEVAIHVADTRLTDTDAAKRFGSWLVELMAS
jgi:LPPG:FO 2-phospho-L-lactate transferase